MSSETEIVKAISYGIDENQEQKLIGNLPQIKEERESLVSSYNEVLSMDIENPKTAKIAKEIRLKIRDNRTKGIEVWHKTTKDFFLKGGQFIDAIKRQEIAVNVRMEENLEQIEKHFEIQEAKKRAELKEKRVSELSQYSEFVPFGIDLGVLSDDEYIKVFNGAKLQFEAKIEADRKAEEERLRLIEIQRLHNERKELALPYYQFWSDFEKGLNFGEQSENDFNSFIERLKNAKSEFDLEQQRIKDENARLAKEKEEAELKAKKEREESERKLAEERAKKDEELRIERQKQADLQAKLDEQKRIEEQAEKQRIADEEKQRKEAEKLAKAPIKNQLNVWVNSFSIPETTIKNDTSESIKQKFESFKNWALKEIDSI